MVKPTLGQVFGLSLLGLAAVLALLFYMVFQLSRETIIESSERIRDGASREIGERVTSFLAKAPDAVDQFQEEVDRGLLDARDPLAVEPALLALLLSTRDITEMTLTYGNKIGFDEHGAVQLAAPPRGQVSAVRAFSEKEEARFWSRHIHQENGAFVADRRELEPTSRFSTLPLRRESGAVISDPTLHATFVTPARGIFRGDFCGAICIGRNSMPHSQRGNAAAKSTCSKWSPMRRGNSLASCVSDCSRSSSIAQCSSSWRRLVRPIRIAFLFATPQVI